MRQGKVGDVAHLVLVHTHAHLFAGSSGDNHSEMEETDDGAESNTGDRDYEFLQFRINRMRLDSAYMHRLLTARPRKLPYEECAKWVQAWGGRWGSEEEWNAWINMGEKRNAYIPAQPDVYYGRIGKWVSWDHFLFGDEKTSKGDDDQGGKDLTKGEDGGCAEGRGSDLWD